VPLAWERSAKDDGRRERRRDTREVGGNISAALTLADRVYILNNGHIVESLGVQAVRDQPDILHRHLGV